MSNSAYTCKIKLELRFNDKELKFAVLFAFFEVRADAIKVLFILNLDFFDLNLWIDDSEDLFEAFDQFSESACFDIFNLIAVMCFKSKIRINLIFRYFLLPLFQVILFVLFFFEWFLVLLLVWC